MLARFVAVTLIPMLRATPTFCLSLDRGEIQTLWEVSLLASMEGNRKNFLLLNCPVWSLSHTRRSCATNTLINDFAVAL